MLDYDKTKESSHNEYLGYNYQYNELYHNQFPMVNLDMLKISQSLHLILLKTTTKKVIWLYINIWAWLSWILTASTYRITLDYCNKL